MNRYEPILKGLAKGMVEVGEIKPNYSNDALLDATLIFQTVFMDKMFDCQNYDNMSMEDRISMVKQSGAELKKLVHTYTGLDTHELAKNYRNETKEM